MIPTDPKIQPQSNDASCTVTALHLTTENIKYSRSNNATSITILINKQPRLSRYRPPAVRHIFAGPLILGQFFLSIHARKGP